MDFSNRISQKLHDEHMATVALMERLQNFVAVGKRPDAADTTVRRFLSDLTGALEGEIKRHFDFEEQHLFSYLTDAGEGEISAHLTDDHNVIRPLGARMIEIARGATANGFDDASWAEFRRLSQEMCERLFGHVQKEETALVPIIEDNMDAGTEARLYEDYVLNG
jgi:hemerythrin-like domain-containing protein